MRISSQCQFGASRNGKSQVKGYIYKASLPPVMLIPQIATHGRCNSAKNMYYFANGVLGHLRAGDRKSRWEERSRDLIVVTLVSRRCGYNIFFFSLQHSKQVLFPYVIAKQCSFFLGYWLMCRISGTTGLG